MNTTKGIIAGLLAGVFWGTTFIAPLILKSFTSLEVTFGRFLFFGLISLLNFSRIKKLLRTLSSKDLIKITLLSAAGFWLYTLVLFAGVQQTNSIISSLIIGILPLTLTLCSRPKFNIYLIIGLCLILLGIFTLLLLPLLLATDVNAILGVKIIGVVFIFIALIMWTWFGISNAYFMASHQEIDSMDYSSLIGVMSFVFMLPIAGYAGGLSHLIHHTNLSQFILWSAVLGLGASWLANICWGYSAKNCPTSMAGALIVSETIFALIYSFIFEHRFPYLNEISAIIFFIIGVLSVIFSQQILSKN